MRKLKKMKRTKETKDKKFLKELLIRNMGEKPMEKEVI